MLYTTVISKYDTNNLRDHSKKNITTSLFTQSLPRSLSLPETACSNIGIFHLPSATQSSATQSSATQSSATQSSPISNSTHPQQSSRYLRLSYQTCANSVLVLVTSVHRHHIDGPFVTGKLSVCEIGLHHVVKRFVISITSSSGVYDFPDNCHYIRVVYCNEYKIMV
jgi:hypothetical protein